MMRMNKSREVKKIYDSKQRGRRKAREPRLSRLEDVEHILRTLKVNRRQ